MKKFILFTLAVLLTSSFVFGQTDQGTIYLGGGISFETSTQKMKSSNTTVDGPKFFGFGIDPKVGFFISDNFMLGAGVGFNIQTTKQEKIYPSDPDEQKNTISAFHISPLARYYVKPWENSAFFVQASLPIGFGTLKNETTNDGTTVSDETKISSFGLNINPGLAFWATEKVCLEVQVGELSYSSVTEKNGSGDNEVKDINSGFSLVFNPSFFSFTVGIHL